MTKEEIIKNLIYQSTMISRNVNSLTLELNRIEILIVNMKISISVLQHKYPKQIQSLLGLPDKIKNTISELEDDAKVLKYKLSEVYEVVESSDSNPDVESIIAALNEISLNIFKINNRIFNSIESLKIDTLNIHISLIVVHDSEAKALSKISDIINTTLSGIVNYTSIIKNSSKEFKNIIDDIKKINT